MGSQDCSRMNSMRAATRAGDGERIRLVKEYKYHLLGLVYMLVTGFGIYRIHRQPYAHSLKSAQYETLFKGTTLASVVAGIVISGKANKRHSQAEAEAKAEHKKQTK